MSEHSSFVILRKDNKNIEKVNKENLEEIYKNDGWRPDHEDAFNKIYKEEEIPAYIPYKRLKYINHFTTEIYDKIVDIEFNSMFSALKNELYMSSYGPKNTVEISVSFAKELVTAIDYLLTEKYDRQIEENVLNNDWISIFGETFTPYFNYVESYNNQDKEDKYFAKYDNEYKGERIMFKRIKTILDTFIMLNEEDSWNDIKYVLIYTVY